MTTPTPEQVLNTPMGENVLEVATVGDYLIRLLSNLWELKGGFSGKRASGSCFWEHDLYEALGRAGLIAYQDDDECVDADTDAGDRLIAAAIQSLGERHRRCSQCGGLDGTHTVRRCAVIPINPQVNTEETQA